MFPYIPFSASRRAARPRSFPAGLVAGLAVAAAVSLASCAPAVPVAAPLKGEPAGTFARTVDYPGFQKPDLPRETMESDILILYKSLRKSIVPFAFFNGARDGKGSGYVLTAGANGEIDGWPSGVAPITQSEAHGYGMIIAVLMADVEPMAKEIFDGFYRVYVNYPCVDDPRLMSWVVPSSGDFSIRRQASATDGDLDAAYALLLAHTRWGGGPAGYKETYLDAAKRAIEGLEANNVIRGEGPFYPRLGIGDHLAYHNYDKYRASRPCDYMVDHLDAFRAATGKASWKELADATAQRIVPELMRQGPLPADFVGTREEAPAAVGGFKGISDEDGGRGDDAYGYNSCRFPWRMAVAYAHTGRPELKASLDRINSWLLSSPLHQENGAFDPQAVKAGYTTDGLEARADWSDDCFSAPFMAGLTAAGPEARPALTALWNQVKEPEDDYYADALTLLSMLHASGNWWKPGPF